jgi:DNA-binding NtrC family response regulator
MKTILLIDDEVDALAVLRDMLSRTGRHVIPSIDAESILSILRKGIGIDLVITDFRMLGLDVLSFMPRLRAFVPKVPVIVLTEHGNVDIYLKAMNLGAFDYMNKPARNAELSRVAKAARQRSETDGSQPIDEKQ